MKLKSQILSVVSPILLLGLISLAGFVLLFMESRAVSALQEKGRQSHQSAIQQFTEIYNLNDIDLVLAEHVELLDILMHEMVAFDITDEVKNQLSDNLKFVNTNWNNSYNKDIVIFDDSGKVLASSTDKGRDIVRSNIDNIQTMSSDTNRKLFVHQRNLYGVTIKEVSTLLVNKYGGEIKNRIFILVSREIPPPFELTSKYSGVVHYAVNKDGSVRTYSPLKNPFIDVYTVDYLAQMSSSQDYEIYVVSWGEATLYTIVNNAYAFNWEKNLLGMVIVVVVIATLSILLILFVLNRAVVTPVSWLSDYIQSSAVFSKPKEHPSLGSLELRTLYRGVVKSTRRLEAIRKRMEQASLLDDLTGLGNRRHFHKMLEQTLAFNDRKQSNCALLLIDLDNFKYVNDAYGHDVGDQLLVKFATILKEQTRGADALFHIIENKSVARLGGDEFAIVLSEVGDPENAAIVAERIIKHMVQGIVVDNVTMPVTASIGIAIYPNDANEINDLMLCVDAAMYKAKRQGKNGYQFYSKQIAKQLARQLKMSSALRQALHDNELEIYVQPYYHTKSLELAGGEVLLRWHHPELGEVSPEVFIPVAEKIGLIREIDIWVIEQVCNKLQQVKTETSKLLSGLSINISAVETRNPMFAKNVEQICQRYQIPPQLLELEITETALIDDLNAAAKVTAELKAMGVTVALDDFGTGYSSISHLKDIKFDKLKIDKSFIAEIAQKDGSFLVADISLLLAHGMGMEITAEGVETETQLDYLRLSGCDYVQGFLFSEAMPINQYIELALEKKVTISA